MRLDFFHTIPPLARLPQDPKDIHRVTCDMLECLEAIGHLGLMCSRRYPFDTDIVSDLSVSRPWSDVSQAVFSETLGLFFEVDTCVGADYAKKTNDWGPVSPGAVFCRRGFVSWFLRTYVCDFPRY